MVEKEVLKIIYRPLLAWICGLSLFYLLIPASIFFIHVNNLCDIFSLNSSNSEIFLGNFNKKVFNFWVVGLTAGTCMVTSILMWWVTGGKGSFLDKYQLQVFTSLSILLLSIYIFTTGGFLDSPYSGVLSLYVANFLLMQGKHFLLNFKIFILSITILFIVLPYFILYFVLHEDNIYLFRWNSSNWLTFLRLCTSLFLFLFTAISSNKINNMLNDTSNS